MSAWVGDKAVNISFHKHPTVNDKRTSETEVMNRWPPIRWRHNDHDGGSNHQPYGCLLNRLFRCKSKKTSKLRVTGLCVGNSPGPVNSPHKGPVTRKMFPFDDVIMVFSINNRLVFANKPTWYYHTKVNFFSELWGAIYSLLLRMSDLCK